MRTEPFERKWEKPARRVFQGNFVTLSPLKPEEDLEDLHRASHGTDAKEAIWKYLPYGPFPYLETMRQHLRKGAESEDPIFLTASLPEGKRIGVISIMSIVPDAGRAELGHIWYSPEVHHSKVNTEAAFLLLRYLFESLEYRRVEWKCDSLNLPSRNTALRMGFQFEGIFRQHLVVKGKNRDTAWFSMLDSEWRKKKENFELWLYHNEDGQVSLGRLNQA